MSRLVTLFLLIGCATSPTFAPSSPISGVWRINRQESDNTRKTVLEAIGIGLGRGAARRSGEELRPAAERTALLRQRMQTTVHTPTAMEIRQSEGEIEILDGTRRIRHFRVDGTWRKQVIDVEGEVDGRAEWVADTLVTELRTKDGMTIRETYQIAAADGPLNVTVSIVNPELEAPIVIRRVYERSR